jgi:hypothetical protein
MSVVITVSQNLLPSNSECDIVYWTELQSVWQRVLDWTTVRQNECALPVFTHRLSFYRKSNKNAFSSCMLMFQLHTLELYQPAAFHSNVTNSAMDMRRFATAEAATPLIRTSSLHIHGCSILRTLHRQKELPNAVRNGTVLWQRPVDSVLICPEECMSLFHPEDSGGRFLQNAGTYRTTRSRIPQDSDISVIVSTL